MTGIIEGIIKFGKTVLNIMEAIPGGAIATIVTQTIALIDTVQETAGEHDAAKLQELRDQLEEKVIAHAHETAKKLRGE